MHSTLHTATLQKEPSTSFFVSLSPQPLIFIAPQGSNRIPYLTLNLGHPYISVYLLLTVKTPSSLSLLCAPPPRSPTPTTTSVE